MAKKNKQDEDLLVDVGQSLTKAEKFVEENRQSLTLIVGVLVVLVGGYFAYQSFYLKPLEKEAQEEIFQAQQYFESDSLKLAINGDGQNLGFVDIADEYSATKAGNLANYYAGISYLNLGEFKNAIEYLDKFSSNDPVFSIIATGSIGDAFWELEQPEEALDYYEKAVSGNENAFVVPFYLKKAGLVAEQLGDLDKAEKYFTRIKKEFKDSREAGDIEKYIARIEAKKNA